MTEVTKTKNCFLRLLSFTIIMFCDFIAKFLKLFMPLETVLLLISLPIELICPLFL